MPRKRKTRNSNPAMPSLACANANSCKSKSPLPRQIGRSQVWKQTKNKLYVGAPLATSLQPPTEGGETSKRAKVVARKLARKEENFVPRHST
eukprot:15129015-Ditylum_brightwellii.AAC.1